MQSLQILDTAKHVTGPVLAGVAVLALAGLASLPFVDLGPLSLQMLQHLAVMNILAPVLALTLPQPEESRRGALLAPATLQLVVLWAWHTPTLQQLAAASALAQTGLMAMLAGSAVWFWHAVIGAARAGEWQALGALLLTGKLACLLGALLIFAPRDLYGLPGLALALCITGPSSLDDQQLAGLLMVASPKMAFLMLSKMPMIKPPSPRPRCWPDRPVVSAPCRFSSPRRASRPEASPHPCVRAAAPTP